MLADDIGYSTKHWRAFDEMQPVLTILWEDKRLAMVLCYGNGHQRLEENAFSYFVKSNGGKSVPSSSNSRICPFMGTGYRASGSPRPDPSLSIVGKY